jgi:dienelactone hydrolase
VRALVFIITIVSILILYSCTEKQNEEIGLIEKEVEYSAEGIVMKGFLVYDGNIKGKRPGVLVVHEWWGHNDYARKRARMLAELGYTALAVDMYGDGKQANHPEDASKFAMEIFNNIESAQARFMAAYNLLKNHKTTDQNKIAAIGYCFGGGVVLHMARIGTDLKAVASFHGGIQAIAPAEKDKVNAFLLVCNGANDPFVTGEQISSFKEEMDSIGVQYEFISYEGAKHSFTNPGADSVGKKFEMPLEYNEKADKESWEKMKSVFHKVFAEK